MKLPRQFQRFSEPTVLVAADEEIAKFWLAGGDAFEALDGVALAPEFKSDAEGAFTSYDGSRVAGPASDKHDTPRKEKFAKQVADRITELVRQKHAIGARLAALPEILHRIEAHLPKDVAKKVLSRTKKNLMKMSEVEIVEEMLGRD